jgi:hypothetical protein
MHLHDVGMFQPAQSCGFGNTVPGDFYYDEPIAHPNLPGQIDSGESTAAQFANQLKR